MIYYCEKENENMAIFDEHFLEERREYNLKQKRANEEKQVKEAEQKRTDKTVEEKLRIYIMEALEEFPEMALRVRKETETYKRLITILFLDFLKTEHVWSIGSGLLMSTNGKIFKWNPRGSGGLGETVSYKKACNIIMEDRYGLNAKYIKPGTEKESVIQYFVSRL